MKLEYTYNELLSLATPEATEEARRAWGFSEVYDPRDGILPSFVGIHAVVKQRYPKWKVWLQTGEAILVAMQIAAVSSDAATKEHCYRFVEEAVVRFGDYRFREGRK